MKHLIAILSLVALTLPTGGEAQSARSGSLSSANSSAGASATSNSGAYAGGSSATVIFNTPAATRTTSAQTVQGRMVNENTTRSTSTSVNYSKIDYNENTNTRITGDSTLRAAPAVTAPSMGSGHPCGLGGSIGISIIGGGASGGATKVDEACLLAQMGQGEAALIMIAERDQSACRALRRVGRIGANSACSTEEKRAQAKAAKAAAQPAATSTRSAPVRTAAAYSRCERSARGIEVRVARGGTKERAVAECREALGF